MKIQLDRVDEFIVSRLSQFDPASDFPMFLQTAGWGPKLKKNRQAEARERPPAPVTTKS